MPQICGKQWYDRQHPALVWLLDPHPGWESLTLPPHRAELIRGKHGVEIVSDYDQGNGNIRFPVVPGEPRTVTVLVQNRGTEVVTLQRFQPRQQSRELSFTDEQGAVQGQPLLLHPGGSHPIPCPVPCPAERMQDPLSPLHPAGGEYPIQVRCLTTCNGHFSAVVIFEFTKEPDGPFSISRYVAAIAESQLAKDLGPLAPFQPYEASLQRHVTVITEDGIPPDRYVVKSPAAILSIGPDCSPARTRFSSLTVWHHRTVLQPCS